MTYGSLFSGIGGFDLGFDRAGMECRWQCEIEPNARKVLDKHYPGVPKFNDVRLVGKANAERVDVICGGFPCQDLSVAGKRAGLDGERSGLWFEFHRIISELEPGIVVIENVPGLLSSNGGRDLAVVLRGLAQLGYRWAYRVLDAQYYGVAQRRRRVFIVASLGDARCGEILFESESLSWDSEPRREEGESVARTFKVRSGNDTERATGGRGYLEQVERAATVGPENQYVELPITIDSDLNANIGIAGTLVKGSPTGGGQQEIVLHGQVEAFGWQASPSQSMNPDVISPTLDKSKTVACISGIGVRRFTPSECLVLQGFPADHCSGIGLSDSAIYRAAGNAVCVNVAEWIGKRAMEVGNRP